MVDFMVALGSGKHVRLVNLNGVKRTDWARAGPWMGPFHRPHIFRGSSGS